MFLKKQEMRDFDDITVTFNKKKGIIKIWNKNLLIEKEVTIGNMLLIEKNDENVKAYEIKVPRKMNVMIGWLLGFKEKQCAPNMHIYFKLKNEAKKEYKAADDFEFVIRSGADENYKLAVCRANGKLYPVAACIGDLSNHEVIGLINRYPGKLAYSKKMVEELLAGKFNFAPWEIKEIHPEKYPDENS